MGFFFFFQAEDGIRDLVRSRGLGDVYKRQVIYLHSISIGDDEKKSQFGGIAFQNDNSIAIDLDLSLIHI